MMAKKSKSWQIFACVVCILLVGPAAFMYWAIGTSLPQKSDLRVQRWPGTTIAPPKNTLSIMTYNIGHGQGIKELPTDWRGEEVTKMQLEDIAHVLNRVDADFVLLQEVDLNSHRSQNINQAEFLLRRTHYPYYACATVWDKNYIPFPFWPLEHQLGRVLAANCIFAKYPLKKHQNVIFDKPEDNAFWYNWGYIDRGAQKVVAQVGDKKISLINLHLEAWEKKARMKQAKIVAHWAQELEGPLIIGGDFNAIPPEACKKSNFADELDVDFAHDETLSILREGLKNHSESLRVEQCPPAGNNTQETNTFTFPADAPSRTLDHLFTTHGAKIIAERVVKEAGTASDHLPVLVEVEYR